MTSRPCLSDMMDIFSSTLQSKLVAELSCFSQEILTSTNWQSCLCLQILLGHLRNSVFWFTSQYVDLCCENHTITMLLSVNGPGPCGEELYEWQVEGNNCLLQQYDSD